MIKAETKTKVAAAKMVATKKQIEPLVAAMQFPLDVKLRQQIREREAAENQLRGAEENITHYTMYLDDYKQQREHAKANLDKLKELPEPVKPTLDDAQKQLDGLLALPWVQEVKVDGRSLKVIARKGFLKTKLEKRIVDCGGGNYGVEFLPEPVMVDMPQYEFNFDPYRCGEGSWANNARHIGIRMIDNADASTFIGGKVMPRLIYAHWATGGGQGMREWSGLCFGEYEHDLNEASIKGIAPFFSELATYLQTCGDEHAYRPKEQWALGLGKPAYNPYVLREAKADETVATIAAQYKIDYRDKNKVEFKEGAEVNPGNATATEIGIEHDGRTATATEIALQQLDAMRYRNVQVLNPRITYDAIRPIFRAVTETDLGVQERVNEMFNPGFVFDEMEDELLEDD